LPVNLAVSLHAANDAKRDVLVPINARYPLTLLAEACGEYVEATGRRLSIEWAMIHDVNDQAATRSSCPSSPAPSAPTSTSSPEPHAGLRRARIFRDQGASVPRPLEGLGVNATIRMTRGAEIDAACGQLAASVGSSGSALKVYSRHPSSARDVRMPSWRPARKSSRLSASTVNSPPTMIMSLLSGF
jgi:23S rRNA (adenine2503-C2)-methyltransferase